MSPRSPNDSDSIFDVAPASRRAGAAPCFHASTPPASSAVTSQSPRHAMRSTSPACPGSAARTWPSRPTTCSAP
ncbi:MAG: hypothetical protein KIT31_11015 [Deltaproteobacteria bacterium]|nr:hypothetical protein [Deltaproteobacteria bacterium]